MMMMTVRVDWFAGSAIHEINLAAAVEAGATIRVRRTVVGMMDVSPCFLLLTFHPLTTTASDYCVEP